MYKIINYYKNLSVVPKAGFWFMVCSVIQKCISTLTLPIFTRIMSTEEYGYYSIYIAWFQIIQLIIMLRLDYSVFNKGMSIYKDQRAKYVSTMQSISTIIFVMIFLLYIPFSGPISGIIGLESYLVAAMFIEALFHAAIAYWLLYKRYEYNYQTFVLFTVLLSVTNVIAGVFAVSFFENKAAARILSCVMVDVIFGIVIYVKNYLRSNVRFDKQIAKFSITFVIPLMPHYLSTYILNQADRIMIQQMIGVAEAGIYSVAYSISTIMNIIVNSIQNALTPWLYEKLEDNKFSDIKKLFVPLVLLAAIPICLFIIIAPEIIKVMAGTDYFMAVYVIPPVVASTILLFIYSFFSAIEFYYFANKFTSVISAIGATVNIILNLIFLPRWGYIAAGYTTYVSYLIFVIAHYIYTKKIIARNAGENVSICSVKFIGLFLLLTTVFIIFISIIYSYIYIRYFFLLIILVVGVIYRKRIIGLLFQLRKRPANK